VGKANKITRVARAERRGKARQARRSKSSASSGKGPGNEAKKKKMTANQGRWGEANPSARGGSIKKTNRKKQSSREAGIRQGVARYNFSMRA